MLRRPFARRYRRALAALISATALVGLLPAVGPASAETPSVPAAPVIASVTAGDRQLAVDWNASTTPADRPVIDYQVMYRAGSSGTWSMASTYSISYDSGTQTGSDTTWAHDRDPLDLGVIPSDHASGVHSYVERTNGGRHNLAGVYRVKADVAALRIRVDGDAAGAATLRAGYTTSPITDLRHNGVELARTTQSAAQSSFHLAGVTPPLGPNSYFWIDGWDHTSTNTTFPEFASATIGSRRLRIDVATVSTATNTTISGLINQQSYEVRVRARNSAGWSAWSSTSTGTPAGTPEAPEGLELESGNSQLVARWRSPSNNGGYAISDYDIQFRVETAGSTWTDWQASTTSTDTTATINSGVSNASTYQVRVRAVNSAGGGPWTAPTSEIAGKPSAPSFTLSTVRRPLPPGKYDKGGLLSMTLAAPANGSAVTDYDLRYRSSGTTTWYTFRDRSLDSGKLTSSETSAAAADPVDFGTFSNPSGRVAVTRESVGSGNAAKQGVYKFSKAVDQLWVRASGTITGGGTVVARWHTSKPTAAELATAGTQIFSATTDSDNEFWQDGWVIDLPANAYLWFHTSDSETLTERRLLLDFTDNAASGAMVLSGLLNGTTYELQARATNARGTGVWGSASGTPGTPVRVVVATPVVKHQSLDVSWAAPASDNASLVLGYDVQYRAGSSGAWMPQTHTTIARSTTVTGLVNGTSYEVRVRARNAHGSAFWSASVTGTPAPQVPDAPAAPTLTSSGTTMTVEWGAPSENGETITDYDIGYSSDNGVTWTVLSDGVSADTTATIASLSNAVTYLVRVRARNSVGPGAWSTASTHTIGRPSAPAAPTLTTGNTQLTVEWTAASGNGSDITDYDVTYCGESGPKHCDLAANWFSLPDTAPSTALSAVISGLANGEVYRVRVRAENAAGTGPWSPVSRLKAGLPEAVSAPTVTVSDGALNASFTAVGGNGTPITSYDVAYCSVNCDSSDSLWQAKSVAAADVGSAIRAWIFELTNGTTYLVRVRGSNRHGSGIWSPVVTAVPGTPAAPAAPTLRGGDHKIIVDWTPPGGNGSTISDYDVRYCASGCSSDASWTSLEDTTDSTDRPAVIADLSIGSTYQVQVRAQNARGVGAWSAASTHTVAASPVPSQVLVPCAPAGLTQLWTDDSCYIKAGVGGIKPFNGWTVRGDGSDYVSLFEYPDLGTVVVTAYNPLGGAAVIETSLDGQVQDVFVVDTIRFAIRSHSLVHNGTTADLTVWLASPDHSSTSIYALNGTDYARSRIQLSLPEALRGATHDGDNPLGDWVRNPTQVVSQHGNAITFRLLVLTQGAHTIGISAYRPAPDADCPLSGPLRCFTPPTPQKQISYVTTSQASATFQSGTVAAPAQFTPTLTAEYGTGEIVASWTPPADNGAPITAYQVEHRRHPGGTWTVTHTLDGDARSATISGVDAGETHRVRMRARNAAGWGNMSWPLAEVTVPVAPPDPPATPSSVSVERSAGVLEASWPAASGATSYHITYRSMNGGTWQLAAFDHESTSITISGVDDSAAYLVGVRARNSGGGSGWRNSPQAPPFTPSPPQQPPGTPSSVSVVRSVGVLEASWPAVSGATSYHVTYSSDGGGSWLLAAFDHPSASITITGADDSSTYLVAVRARNAAGGSGWRNSSPVPPLLDPPGTPSSVSVVRSVGVLEASWPAVSGATSYHVTYRSLSGGTWQLAALNHPSNSITISGVDDSAAYLVGVRARNSAGDSGWRNSPQAPPL